MPLTTLSKVEVSRMAHARAQELELQESPAGKNGHNLLSKVAKDNYGRKSWSLLNIYQMQAIHDFLTEHKRMPNKGELGK